MNKNLLFATVGVAVAVAAAFSLARTDRGESYSEPIIPSGSTVQGIERGTDQLVVPGDVNGRAADAEEPLPAVPAVEEPRTKNKTLWARRDISDFARQNIIARRESVTKRMGYMTGQLEPKSEAYYAAQGRRLAEFAIMIIYDAEGRSIPNTEAGQRERPEGKYYDWSSGGMRYYVPAGEFPAYDDVMAKIEQYPDGVPVADVPMEGLHAIGERALQYQLQ